MRASTIFTVIASALVASTAALPTPGGSDVTKIDQESGFISAIGSTLGSITGNGVCAARTIRVKAPLTS